MKKRFENLRVRIKNLEEGLRNVRRDLDECEQEQRQGGVTVYPGTVVYCKKEQREYIVCYGQCDYKLAEGKINVWFPSDLHHMDSKYKYMDDLESGYHRQPRGGVVGNFKRVREDQ